MNDRASFGLMCRDMPFICCNVSGLSINLGGGRSLTHLPRHYHLLLCWLMASSIYIRRRWCMWCYVGVCVMARTDTTIELQLLSQCGGICDTNIALDTVSKVRHLHDEDQSWRRPTSTSMRDVMLGSSLQKMTRDERWAGTCPALRGSPGPPQFHVEDENKRLDQRVVRRRAFRPPATTPNAPPLNWARYLRRNSF